MEAFPRSHPDLEETGRDEGEGLGQSLHGQQGNMGHHVIACRRSWC